MTFVDLHCHSEYSALDGLSTPREMAARAAAYGAPALAVTDHENCSAHPAFQAACDEAGIKPVLGMETYFVPDRHVRERGYGHLILLAMNNQGLHDLWALSTEAFATGKFHKARIDWELLERYGSNLIVTSACLGGPVSKPILSGDFGQAGELLRRFQGLLGDRFYLEIQPNQLADQIRLNRYLAQASEVTGIPLVAATDAHYPDASQHRLHKLWLACQTGTGNEDYWNYIHMYGPDEVRQGLAYLGDSVVERAMAQTVAIAGRCTARITGHAKPPVFTRGGTPRDDSQRLLDLCVKNWHKVPNTTEYQERLVREWNLVASKGLAGSYLIVEDVISWTRSHGKLVGPGRGSAAGSLMSYLLGITTMDPIPHGLLFERFLTEGRTALPDFDMDFPTSWRPSVTGYMVARYGEDHVVRVGTTSRFQTKGILNKLFSVMQHDLAPDWFEDSKLAASIVDDAESHTAGLGLPWDEVMEHPDLQQLAAKYSKVFEAAEQLVGRVRTYGQHPAGLVVSTDTDLTRSLPMRLAEGKKLLIAQFDFRTLEAMGLFKLDFLTLRTIDTLQKAIELIEQRTGKRIDPAAWTAEQHEDPQVWDEIGTGHTKGLFQLESGLCSNACAEMKPRSLGELADLISYIRPGPRNSGLAAAYLRRRAGTEEVTYPHPLLADDLASTQGVMLYQESLLAACRILGGYDTGEADKVRSILGKKKTEKIAGAGEEFIRRCVARGHDEESITGLWAAMAEFGKYGFNRAHATAYATLGYWTAWMKVHYPIEMLTAILSTVDKDRHHEFATDARRLGVRILPPDVRYCGGDFRPEGLSIRYGLSSLKGLGDAKIARIVGAQPYTDFADFVTRSQVDVGAIAVLARAGALDELVPTRRGLMTVLAADKSGDATRCVHKDDRASNHGLPCTFNWDGEEFPARVGKRGPLPPVIKPPPRNCTRACRHYTPPSEIDATAIPEWSPAELWELDQDAYGTWMSDAAFAQVDPELREQGREIALTVMGAVPGSYPLLAVYGGAQSAISVRGTTYWRVRLSTEVSDIRAVVFQPRDGEPDVPGRLRYVKQGTLIAAQVTKDRYPRNGSWRTSWRLTGLTPLGG